MPAHRLASGLEVACLDAWEAAFLERDVEAYFALDLGLEPDMIVLDVGANIGLFAAGVSHRLEGRARILCFEPAPPLFAVLSENAASLPGEISALDFGLGAEQATVPFSFFPRLSCLSSAHRGQENLLAEIQRVKAALLELIRSGGVMPELAMLPGELLDAYLESFLKSRARPEHYEARLRPLSAVLEEQAVRQIDLLKIDVEGAELEVLAGMDEAAWAMTRRIVLELEGFSERSASTRALLEAKGFEVQLEHDTVQAAGDYGLVLARRP